MGNRYESLIDEILKLNHSEAEWRRLRMEFDAAMKTATEEEKEMFSNSGAGEAVFMATNW